MTGHFPGLDGSINEMNYLHGQTPPLLEKSCGSANVFYM